MARRDDFEILVVLVGFAAPAVVVVVERVVVLFVVVVVVVDGAAAAAAAEQGEEEVGLDLIPPVATGADGLSKLAGCASPRSLKTEDGVVLTLLLVASRLPGCAAGLFSSTGG